MRNMFYQVTFFNQDIGSWDTSKVEDMRGMFQYASWFNQDIARWNSSSIIDQYSTIYSSSYGGTCAYATINGVLLYRHWYR